MMNISSPQFNTLELSLSSQELKQREWWVNIG